MRAVLLACLFMLPSVAAEYGHEEDGWPVGEHGFSHDPEQRFDPAALAELQARAWTDLSEAQQAALALHDAPMGPINRVGPATVYPYYPLVVAEVQRLAELHPDLVRLHSAGKSTAQLDLWMLEIGNFADEGADDFQPFDEREVVWLDGGTHSNEYSGVYFVLAVAQYLIESYGSDEFATWVVDNRHTWIMPMVNPDGSHVMGRMNANLVNINRNYPVIWGGEGTDVLLNNPGPAPGSEVETQVNIEWFNITRPDYYASIHCCGNLWLFPYGEDGYDPADVDMMNEVCARAFPAEIQDACGPIWSTIYPASGSSVDTAYEYTGAVSFGFEMSGRSNLAGPWGEPVTFAEVFAQEAESWQGVRHAFEEVHRYGAFLEITDIEANEEGLFVTIQNTGLGNSTGASLRYQGDGVFDAISVPAIAAGSETTVFVNGDRDGGENALEMEYAKRIWETSNVRETSVQILSYEREGVAFENSTWLVPRNARAGEPMASAGLDAPAAPLGLLLVGLTLLVRRR